MDYLEYIRSRLPARPFKGRLGERFSGFVGGYLANLIAEGVSLVAESVWLIAGQPNDVLKYQGSDRRLRRYLAETDNDYRARLERAVEIWESAGTGACIEDELDSASYEDAEVHSPRDWGRSPVDHITQFWIYLPFASHADGSEFFECGAGLICGNGHLAGDGTPFGGAPLAGSGLAIAGEHTAGITASLEVINELRYIAKNFKAGHEVCRQIIVEIDGPVCGTGIVCGAGIQAGGTVGVIGTGVAET
jgi:hypothetical protein